ncbi:hypothetical protein O7628_10525 [Micromonospora sp. WMMD956]|nr:hypothetical protein [Micromonospora sp. WMMD956]MDG4815938.1 hypothetical protein [Micromonospora sp. WMMD956]
MTAADAPAEPWWQRELEAHRQREGRCPICGAPKRCWPWANANSARVVAQLMSSPASVHRG